MSFAQTSGQHEVVGSAGEVLQTKNGSVSFTVGEIAIQPMVDSTTGVTFSEGFQQTYFWITEIKEESTMDFSVKVWPNPTTRYLNIELGESNRSETIRGELYNLIGVKIGEFNPRETQRVDLLQYPVSDYILRIYDTENTQIRVFKITKM